jgi:hypothetical protein
VSLSGEKLDKVRVRILAAFVSPTRMDNLTWPSFKTVGVKTQARPSAKRRLLAMPSETSTTPKSVKPEFVAVGECLEQPANVNVRDASAISDVKYFIFQSQTSELSESCAA